MAEIREIGGPFAQYGGYWWEKIVSLGLIIAACEDNVVYGVDMSWAGVAEWGAGVAHSVKVFIGLSVASEKASEAAVITFQERLLYEISCGGDDLSDRGGRRVLFEHFVPGKVAQSF